MAGDNHCQLSRDPASLAGDGCFDAGVSRDVDHQAACRACQVVVMLPAEGLAQLESIVMSRTGDPLQDADAFEHDEVAVQRALRHRSAIFLEQVGHRHRTRRRSDRVENRPALPGVPLSDASKTTLGRDMQILALPTTFPAASAD